MYNYPFRDIHVYIRERQEKGKRNPETHQGMQKEDGRNKQRKMNYKDFLKSKIKRIEDSGFDIEDSELNINLFDFQKFIVKKALKKGKFAVFTDTGTGKTIIQLEWANHVKNYTNKPVLILAPLAVSGQTIQEGKKFGIEITKYKSQKSKGIYITNYEQLDNINPNIFSGIVLDESSILKNFTGKTKQKILDSFKDMPYKLACTATPSPNDHLELGNHSEFLNILREVEMKSTFFIQERGETQKWYIKGHAKQSFWDWVMTWAIMMVKPQDLGFKAKGYDLPELRLIDEKIITSNGLSRIRKAIISKRSSLTGLKSEVIILKNIKKISF